MEKIVSEGTKIYQGIKNQYDPEYTGKFLAIEVDSAQVYFGDTSVEAMQKARAAHPNTVFYLVKIGFDTAESVLKSRRNPSLYGTRSF